jgi:hypothetical protein
MHHTGSTLECHAALKNLRDEGQDLLEGPLPLDAVLDWQQRVEDQLAKLANDQPSATFPNPLDPGAVPVLADLTHQKLGDLEPQRIGASTRDQRFL